MAEEIIRRSVETHVSRPPTPEYPAGFYPKLQLSFTEFACKHLSDDLFESYLDAELANFRAATLNRWHEIRRMEEIPREGLKSDG